MENPDDIELVRRAICERASGFIVWDDSLAERVFREVRGGLSIEGVVTFLRDHVERHGATCIARRRQNQPEWPQGFWYRVLVPVPVESLRHGIFVKLILSDDDPEAPQVRIVSIREGRQ